MIHPYLHSNLLIIFITFPMIATLIVYYITYALFSHRWKAIHISVQATAIFYIIAVIILLERFLEQTVIGIILILLISLLAIILIVQWKKKTEVVLRNGLKVLARISFLLFALIYLLLLSYEFIQNIYTNYVI